VCGKSLQGVIPENCIRPNKKLCPDKEMDVRHIYLALGILFLAVTALAVAQTQHGTKDTDLGLSKTSVFDVPTPKPFEYIEAFPGTSKILPRPYPGAPPQIPHNIDAFKPITAGNNACIGCHDKPDSIGTKEAKNLPPMPLSHYTATKGKANQLQRKVSARRFLCTQCHVPQAKVKPLVGNTF
jgi:cytochrome c-type protein NapB